MFILLNSISALIIQLISVHHCTGFVEQENNGRLFKQGDVMVGGLFNLRQPISSQNHGLTHTSCNQMINDDVILIEAMLSAIEEVNKNPNLLPNITLGYDIQGTCDESSENMFYAIDAFTALESRLVAENNSKCDPAICNMVWPLIGGLIGPASDTASESVSSLFRLHSIPVISYNAAAPQLGNHFLYPSFFRTIYADDKQATALVDLIQEMGWSYIAAIGADNELGRQGIYELKKGLWAQNNLCLSIEDYFSDKEQIKDIILNMKNGVRAQSNSSITVAVLFMDYYSVRDFLKVAYKMELTEITWIGVDHWTNEMGMMLNVSGHLEPRWINGSLAFEIPHDIPDSFKIFLQYGLRDRIKQNPMLKTFVCQQCYAILHNYDITQMSTPLNCSIEFVTSMDCLNAVNIALLMDRQRTIGAVISAVNALAHALNSSYTIHQQTTLSKLVDVAHWQLVEDLNSLNISQACPHWPNAPDLRFDDNGNLEEAKFFLKNYHLGATNNPMELLECTTVGAWCQEYGITLNKSAINWKTEAEPISMCNRLCVPGERVVYGPTACCWQCEKCEKGTISNQTQVAKCTVCPPNTHAHNYQTFCKPNRISYIAFDSSIGIGSAALSAIGEIFIIICLITTIKFKRRPSFQDKETLKSAVLTNCALGYLYISQAGYEPTVCLCTIRRLIWQVVITMHCVTHFFMSSIGRRASKCILHRTVKIPEKHCPLVANWLFDTIGIIMLIGLGIYTPSQIDLIDLEYVTGELGTTYKGCTETFQGGMFMLVSMLYAWLFWIPALLDAMRMQRLQSITQFVNSTRRYTNDGDDQAQPTTSKYERLSVTYILYSGYISVLLLFALGPIYFNMNDPFTKNLILLMGAFTDNTIILGFYIFPRIKKSLLASLSKGQSRSLTRRNSIGEMFIVSAKFSVTIRGRR